MKPVSVLVGTREDAASGRIVRSRGDAVALGLALGLAGADAVRVVSGADMPDSTARDYLALGARRIEILPCAPVDDLAAAVARSELVFTGMRAESGLGSGVLPYVVADLLMCPLIPNAVAVTREADAWIVTQALPRGARRRLRVTVPAVLAIHPGAPVTLRHSYRDQLAGEVHRHPAPKAAADPTPWTFVQAARRLQRLQAQRAQSGHHRMLDAVASEPAAASSIVLTEGSARDKARIVFDHLQQHALLGL